MWAERHHANGLTGAQLNSNLSSTGSTAHFLRGLGVAVGATRIGLGSTGLRGLAHSAQSEGSFPALALSACLGSLISVSDKYQARGKRGLLMN